MFPMSSLLESRICVLHFRTMRIQKEVQQTKIGCNLYPGQRDKERRYPWCSTRQDRSTKRVPPGLECVERHWVISPRTWRNLLPQRKRRWLTIRYSARILTRYNVRRGAGVIFAKTLVPCSFLARSWWNNTVRHLLPGAKRQEEPVGDAINHQNSKPTVTPHRRSTVMDLASATPLHESKFSGEQTTITTSSLNTMGTKKKHKSADDDRMQVDPLTKGDPGSWTSENEWWSCSRVSIHIQWDRARMRPLTLMNARRLRTWQPCERQRKPISLW